MKLYQALCVAAALIQPSPPMTLEEVLLRVVRLPEALYLLSRALKSINLSSNLS